MPLFQTITLVGAGLIGASLAYNIRHHRLGGRLRVVEASEDRCDEVLALGLAHEATTDLRAGVGGADLVILCTPVGTYADLAATMGAALTPGILVSDVGSVKAQVMADVGPHLPAGVHFVPGHPIAGTEKSGPTAGFRELFENRWVILTPPVGAAAAAVSALRAFWEACGAKVELMDAQAHDMVLAMTSHLPHLIAYSIVDTAVKLQGDLKSEVIKYSASGFRDFTRMAGSDPIMWRDIFLSNKRAVLSVLDQFSGDLANLKDAIERGDAETLFDVFTETRAIRRGVVEQGQAGTFDPREPRQRDPEVQTLALYGG